MIFICTYGNLCTLWMLVYDFAFANGNLVNVFDSRTITLNYWTYIKESPGIDTLEKFLLWRVCVVPYT